LRILSVIIPYKIKIPPLRIIYTPDFKNKIIWIKAIGFREGIYK